MHGQERELPRDGVDGENKRENYIVEVGRTAVAWRLCGKARCDIEECDVVACARYSSSNPSSWRRLEERVAQLAQQWQAAVGQLQRVWEHGDSERRGPLLRHTRQLPCPWRRTRQRVAGQTSSLHGLGVVTMVSRARQCIDCTIIADLFHYSNDTNYRSTKDSKTTATSWTNSTITKLG